MALLSNMLPPGGVVTPDGVQTLTNKTLNTPTINTPTINNGQANNLALANPTVNTSLNFSGTGLRLTGDFSNATVANRLSYQTSVTNGSTVVPLYPNGSGSVVGFAAPSTPYVVEVNGSERLRIDTSGNVLVTGSGGLGYGAGSGGTVTQATSKSTLVTLNKPSGQITTSSALLGAGARVDFDFINSTLAATDTIILSIIGFTSYSVAVRNISTGACTLALTNNSGSGLSEAVTINFTVIKGATS